MVIDLPPTDAYECASTPGCDIHAVVVSPFKKFLSKGGAFSLPPRGGENFPPPEIGSSAPRRLEYCWALKILLSPKCFYPLRVLASTPPRLDKKGGAARTQTAPRVLGPPPREERVETTTAPQCVRKGPKPLEGGSPKGGNWRSAGKTGAKNGVNRSQSVMWKPVPKTPPRGAFSPLKKTVDYSVENTHQGPQFGNLAFLRPHIKGMPHPPFCVGKNLGGQNPPNVKPEAI